MTRGKGASKELILKTACSLARADGWASVSVRKIAGKIHYTAPVVYEFFENKEAMVAEVVVEGFKGLRQQLFVAWKKQAPRMSLIPPSLAYWRFAAEHPETYAAISLSGAFRDQHPEIWVEAGIFCSFVSGIIAEWGKFHGARNLDPVRLTEMFWAHLHGIVSLGLSRQLGEPEKIESLIEHSMSIFEKGLLSGR